MNTHKAPKNPMAAWSYWKNKRNHVALRVGNKRMEVNICLNNGNPSDVVKLQNQLDRLLEEHARLSRREREAWGRLGGN